MGKRGADKQGGKDDASSDEGEDPGLRSQALRPVEGRNLPKRKGLGEPAPPSATPPAAAPFSFGAPSANPAPSAQPFSFGSNGSSSAAAAAPAKPSAFGGFSFGAPKSTTPAAEPASTSPTAAPPKAFGAGFGFGGPKVAAPVAPEPVQESSPAAPPKPFGGFSFGAPKPAVVVAPKESPQPAESAPAAAAPPKPFGGFSFGVSTPSAPVAAPAATPAVPATASSWSTPAAASLSSAGPTPSLSKPPAESEVTYYTALRGLNTSFLTFVTQSLDSNEFLDLSTVLPGLQQQYEKHLGEASAKAGWKPEAASPAAAAPAAATNGGSTTPSVYPKLPAPPTVGGFALLKPSSSTASTTSSGGFTPTFMGSSSAPKSAFSFKPPATAAAPQTPAKKSSDTVNKMVEDVLAEDAAADKADKLAAANAAKSAFSFGGKTAAGAKDKPATPRTSGLFSFAPSGPIAAATPDSKKFAPSAVTSSPLEPPPKLGKFGPDGTTPQLSFGGAKSGDTNSPAKPFSFGASGSTGFGFGAASESSKEGDKAADKVAPASTFSFFGAAKPATAAPGGSAFSFAPPAAAAAGSAGAAAPAKPFPFGGSGSFSFGATPASTVPASGATSGVQTPAAAEPAEPSKNLADAVGAGEENEETTVEQRGKLFALANGKYDVAGLGQFKIKRDKDNDSRRILMRADGSGNIIMNMAVHEKLEFTAEANNVKFIGFDQAGVMKPYLLRVKNKDVAAELAEALGKEVAALKK